MSKDNKETVEPKAKTEVIKPSFVEPLKGGNFVLFLKAILETDVNILASNQYQDIWPLFLEKFPDLSQRGKVFDTILDKTSTMDGSNLNIELMTSQLMISNYPSDKLELSELNLLKAKMLGLKAKNDLEMINPQKHQEVQIDAAKLVLKVAESAYALYQKLHWGTHGIDSPNSGSKLYIENQIALVKGIINQAILKSEKIEGQFDLATNALDYRKSELPNNQECYVDLLIKLAEYGTKLPTQALRCQALKYAEEAYNIISTPRKDTKLTEFLIKDIKILAELSQSFGDKEKAELLKKQADYISHKHAPNTSASSTQNPESSYVKPFEFMPIIVHGTTEESVINVKKQIQDSVLNPIKAQAAAGMWVQEYGVSYLTANYGVSGYIDEKYLKKMLGPLNSTENYKIALELCFEAIGIGIISAQEKNPICAAIFCQNYPEIISNIQKKHPEYLVDGYILKTSLINAQKVSKALLGQELSGNHGGYNKYFEDFITPIIKKRCEDKILSKVKDIAKEGNWSSSIEYYFNQYLSDGYITQVMGNNLTQIKDVYNIVRILAFEEMTRALGSNTNFACVKKFTESYPELLSRIKAEHPTAITNKSIEDICNSVNVPKTNYPVAGFDAKVASTETKVDLSGDHHDNDSSTS